MDRRPDTVLLELMTQILSQKAYASSPPHLPPHLPTPPSFHDLPSQRRPSTRPRPLPRLTPARRVERMLMRRYEQLRTKEQLGYIANLGMRYDLGVCGIRVIVQVISGRQLPLITTDYS